VKFIPNLQRTTKYLLAFICLISFRFQQPSSYDPNSKIKAVYLYNFTRYFEWPDEKKENNFVIYVVGKNEALISELKNLAGKKKVGNQDIEIKNSSSFDPSISSNIIYFTPDVLKPITDAASKNKKKGALVVAESPGACKAGASINFIVAESKLKFEYNKNTAVKAGLKTNEDFKALAAVNIE
jgi:hypothetical protein